MTINVVQIINSEIRHNFISCKIISFINIGKPNIKKA